MLTKEQIKGHVVRAVVDLVILGLVLIVVFGGLWAYHGQLAYNYIVSVQQAQAAAMQRQSQAQPPK